MNQNAPHRPSKAELQGARSLTLPDLIEPSLRVLFCGINPGLYSSAVGHHYGRPGNRFWAALHAGGFTGRVLSPFEDHELLTEGYGLTNLVDRATPVASELSRAELVDGGRCLGIKVAQYRPRFVAVLGVGAYRIAFARPAAVLGRQSEDLCGSTLWVLPSPSGLNAHHQASDLARLFRELHTAVMQSS